MFFPFALAANHSSEGDVDDVDDDVIDERIRHGSRVFWSACVCFVTALTRL